MKFPKCGEQRSVAAKATRRTSCGEFPSISASSRRRRRCESGFLRLALKASSSSGSSSIKLIVAFSIAGVLAVLIFVFLNQVREPVVSNQSSLPVISAANFQEIKAKAERGDAASQNLVGEMYAKGTGVPQDYKEAARWYRLAADQGLAAAQKHLAELYEVGQGVPLDSAEALKWCQRAAEQGHLVAQYSLALMLTAGRGVKVDDTEAVKWCRAAAEGGYAVAQFNLGNRYLTGKGAPQDQVEAFKWLSLAAAQGLPDATEMLAPLKKAMTSEQIKEGKRRIAAFVPRKPPSASR